MPRSSLIVPARDAVTRLGRSLRALLAQTDPDFEILVVDDGSCDGSQASVRALRSPRIRLIQQRPRGMAGALNTGIAHARGTFIGFCPPGAVWHPGKLEAHVRQLSSDPALGLSYSARLLMTGGGADLPDPAPTGPRRLNAVRLLRDDPVGDAAGVVMRRAALEAIAFRPAGEILRDWWFDETCPEGDGARDAWLRLALTSDWDLRGLPRPLLRSPLERAVPTEAEWQALCARAGRLAPALASRHADPAAALRLRRIARLRLLDGDIPGAGAALRRAWQSAPLTLVGDALPSLEMLRALARARHPRPETPKAPAGLPAHPTLFLARSALQKDRPHAAHRSPR
ncbi:glycosyltransferase [Pseudooceanicola sp. CBS1P-1]|uniref:Glycosyltransferase n=1 Tax=Pseudooceanicola albus TaxID=2692189 RepID=A0A6L7G4C9_9RHOB|nr:MULTISPECIES: glycosyltransferase family A protein [Pseudooceanicola]MBT9383036.1 glycosyltransferase [Pseudooceanicola endophyticus]MXN19224.1 glycosyltransferase [Pseudooceanicola albus]